MRLIEILIILLLLTASGGCLSTGESSKDLFVPRENSEEGIKITAAYLPDINDVTAFEIRVTAHTDYNDDFKNTSYLRDLAGKKHDPISYEGSGGHHASGILRFPKVEGKGFELVIQDVAGVKERTFKW